MKDVDVTIPHAEYVKLRDKFGSQRDDSGEYVLLWPNLRIRPVNPVEYERKRLVDQFAAAGLEPATIKAITDALDAQNVDAQRRREDAARGR